MRNRILHVLLALSLTIALLFSIASCNNTPDNESIGSQASEQDKDPGNAGGPSGNKQLSGKLSISQCWNFLYLQGAIDEFTMLHPDVEIVLNKYDSDWEKYWAQVGAQLIAGTADDILDGSDFSYMDLADRGFLADFFLLMRDDPNFNEDDYYVNVFKGLEYKGGLYNFPTLFIYNIIGANNASPDLIGNFRQRDAISNRGMLDLFNALPDRGGRYVEKNFDAYYIIQNNFSDFVDFENRTCSFNTDKFIRLLEDAKAATNPIRIEENQLNMTLSGQFPWWELEEYALQYLFFGTRATSYEMLYPYADNPFSHFIPVVNEKGNVIHFPLKSFFINENSKNKELAWEFVKFLASPEYIRERDVTIGIPVNKETFRAHAASYIAFDIEMRQQDHEAIEGEPSDLAQGIVAAIEGYNNMPMETPGYTFGDSLTEIVNATMYSFYLGVLTAEQAASELQNKISLYLME